MSKKIAILLSIVFLISASAKADILNMGDSPTTRILEYSSYQLNFRFFGGGNMQTNINFGIFQFLTLGFTCELDNFVGSNEITAAMPSLLVKMLIYSGDMNLPSVSLGYDGQGYYSTDRYSTDYLQDPRGVYLVLGKELFVENLMINAGLNSNSFKESGIRFFTNAMFPIIQDIFFLISEIDNMGSSNSRLNLGVNLKVSQTVDVEFFIRDCWGGSGGSEMPNERVFRISHTGKF
ncbi:MAG: hypothetical protein LBV16_05230 [Elusimicrobiota bacterium]|nr:hypothetical protein [Elusimicrobiota bacterium]